MQVIPIFGGVPEQIEERLSLFRAFGCEIYRDGNGNGQLYAVARTLTDWSSIEGLQVYETEQVPSHWKLVEETRLPIRSD